MASTTRSYTLKKKRKMRTAGRKRKNAVNRHGTTPAKSALFDAAPKKA